MDDVSDLTDGGTRQARDDALAGRQRVLVISGLAGSGKTSALAALSDLGYEAVDNPPLELIGIIVDDYKDKKPGARLAIGLDARSSGFSAGRLVDVIEMLKARSDLAFSTLFMTCAQDTLLRRFHETRRRHPFSGEHSIEKALVVERSALEPVQERADFLLDTTDLSLTALRRGIKDRFGDVEDGIAVSVTSFGFKRGAPRDPDLMFDVRFLNNPYWDPDLRSLTGRDPVIRNFVQADPGYDEFYRRLLDLVLFLLPAYEREGKSYLTIGIGCTGGRHRSVTVAESLADSIRAGGYNVDVRHRDAASAEE